MTSQWRDTEIVCVCFVHVCVCMRKCDMLQSRWEEGLSSCITSSCQKAFILAPRVTLCYRQICVLHLNTLIQAHKQCEECFCVRLYASYCWCRCRHFWEGCVQCNQQQSWPFALDFVSSSILQREEKAQDRDILRRFSRLWFPRQ